jgi:hypothetical protein
MIYKTLQRKPKIEQHKPHKPGELRCSGTQTPQTRRTQMLGNTNPTNQENSDAPEHKPHKPGELRCSGTQTPQTKRTQVLRKDQ